MNNLEHFPFPGEAACMEELQRDLYYHKIPPKDYSRIIHAAWIWGENAAHQYFSVYPTVFDAILQSGLSILRIDEDHIVGSVRYFAEFFEKNKKIILYTQSIRLWSEYNGLPYSRGEELILTHEFFHYLECAEHLSIKKPYRIPILKIGNFIIHSSTLRSISEIGAHSFTHTYYKLLHKSNTQ